MDIALVTGANRGIGKQIARGLAAAGMVVLLGSRDVRRGRSSARDLREAGDVRPVKLDVTDAVSIAETVAYVDREFGRLDVLVNNAAVLGRDLAPEAITAAVLRPVFETNVLGLVTMTHAMLPLLHRAPAGRIINVSSGRATFAHATSDAEYDVHLGYHTSKTAVNMLTVLYARALRGTSVRVCAVCPGRCSTELNNSDGRTAAQGAAITVRVATEPDACPHGGFIDDNGAIAW